MENFKFPAFNMSEDKLSPNKSISLHKSEYESHNLNEFIMTRTGQKQISPFHCKSKLFVDQLPRPIPNFLRTTNYQLQRNNPMNDLSSSYHSIIDRELEPTSEIWNMSMSESDVTRISKKKRKPCCSSFDDEKRFDGKRKQTSPQMSPRRKFRRSRASEPSSKSNCREPGWENCEACLKVQSHHSMRSQAGYRRLMKEKKRLEWELKREKMKFSKLQKTVKFIKDNGNIFNYLKELYTKLMHKTGEMEALASRRTVSLMDAAINCKKQTDSLEDILLVRRPQYEAVLKTVDYLKQLIAQREETWSLTGKEIFQKSQIISNLEAENLVLKNLLQSKESSSEKDPETDKSSDIINKELHVLRGIILKIDKSTLQKSLKKKVCLTDEEKLVVLNLMENYLRRVEKQFAQCCPLANKPSEEGKVGHNRKTCENCSTIVERIQQNKQVMEILNQMLKT